MWVIINFESNVIIIFMIVFLVVTPHQKKKKKRIVLIFIFCGCARQNSAPPLNVERKTPGKLEQECPLNITILSYGGEKGLHSLVSVSR